MVIENAFDYHKNQFRTHDIAVILYNRRSIILNNPDYESITYENIYICQKLLKRKEEIEQAAITQQSATETETEIIPADFSLYPNLEPLLSDWIKNNQQLLNLVVEGIIKAYKVLKPGRLYNSSWAHLYKVLLELKIFISDLNEKNHSKFAEAMYEVLKSANEQTDIALSIETIRKNVGENQDILNVNSLALANNHNKYLRELADCFDGKLKF